MSIRLLIADDHEIVRAGVAALLSGTGIQVVAEACEGSEVLPTALQHRPQVVLLDVRMSDIDGMTCLAQLQSELSETAVIMFSAYDNPTYVARAAALGAAGYLNKKISRDALIAAITKVAAGETLWSGEEIRRTPMSGPSDLASDDLEVGLTKREREVLKQLALGLSNKEISLALSISYETVKEHVQHVLRKLGVTDRTQAAVWAVRKRLV